MQRRHQGDHTRRSVTRLGLGRGGPKAQAQKQDSSGSNAGGCNESSVIHHFAELRATETSTHAPTIGLSSIASSLLPESADLSHYNGSTDLSQLMKPRKPQDKRGAGKVASAQQRRGSWQGRGQAAAQRAPPPARTSPGGEAARIEPPVPPPAEV